MSSDVPVGTVWTHIRESGVQKPAPSEAFVAMREACEAAEARFAGFGGLLAASAFEKDRQLLCQLRAALALAEKEVGS